MMTATSRTEEAVEYGICGTCGYLMLPVLDTSPCGHPGPVGTKTLQETGEVYSWTRMRLGEERILVMGDFFGGELRVTAPLLDAESVAIGDRIRLVVGVDTPYAYVMAD